MFGVRGLDMRTMTTSYGRNPHLSKPIRIQSPATEPSPQKKHRLLQVIGVFVPAGALVIIYRLLSELSTDILYQVFQGLGGIACALGGLGVLWWCVKRGLAWDSAQEEARTRNEPVIAR